MSLELLDVSRSYGRTRVLSGITLRFAPGRLAALVGPNGAGKTTLLRIAAGLVRPGSGRVSETPCLYYGGHEVLPVLGSENSLRRSLGLEPLAGGTRTLGRLSRGELHLVGLRAALDVDGPALLLDEPWTSLEPDARERLNDRIRSRARAGSVVVCSTHDLDEVSRIADDVVFLRDAEAVLRRREDQPGGEFRRERLLALFRSDRRVA